MDISQDRVEKLRRDFIAPVFQTTDAFLETLSISLPEKQLFTKLLAYNSYEFICIEDVVIKETDESIFDNQMWNRIKAYFCARISFAAATALKNGVPEDEAFEWCNVHLGYVADMDCPQHMTDEDTKNVERKRMTLSLKEHESKAFSALATLAVKYSTFEECSSAIRQAVILIRKNFFKKELTVESVAREIGLSVAHFSRKFKEEMEQAPGRYIRQLRLQTAKRILSSDYISIDIKDVAAVVGYEQRRFSKSYFEWFGFWPSETKRHPEQ